jgi:uncharacterized damage-inducible protein DinB
MFSVLAFLVLTIPALAHNTADHHEKKAEHSDPYIQLILDQVTFMKSRIVGLAEAIPEEKYSWKPSEEVRSTAAQLVHTLTAAYGIPSMMGAEMPSNINWETEKTMTDKKEIISNLTASFDSVTEFLKNYDTANFEKIVETPFGKFSQRNMILILNNHYHEHLGQLIVYARSNGVVPPWSQEQSNSEE